MFALDYISQAGSVNHDFVARELVQDGNVSGEAPTRDPLRLRSGQALTRLKYAEFRDDASGRENRWSLDIRSLDLSLTWPASRPPLACQIAWDQRRG
jgi:hypothetical protein